MYYVHVINKEQYTTILYKTQSYRICFQSHVGLHRNGNNPRLRTGNPCNRHYLNVYTALVKASIACSAQLVHPRSCERYNVVVPKDHYSTSSSPTATSTRTRTPTRCARRRAQKLQAHHEPLLLLPVLPNSDMETLPLVNKS
jgi:hypothetical protein